MKKLASLTVLLVAAVAQAGAKYNLPVYVDVKAQFASGSFGTARNSADNVQYIQCVVAMYPASSGQAPVGNCEATTAAGVHASCYTTDTELLHMMQTMSDNAWISFSWAADGTCSWMRVVNGSTSEPKH